MLVTRMDHENSLVTDNTCVHVRLRPFGFLRPPVFRAQSIYKRASNFIKPYFSMYSLFYCGRCCFLFVLLPVAK